MQAQVSKKEQDRLIPVSEEARQLMNLAIATGDVELAHKYHKLSTQYAREIVIYQALLDRDDGSMPSTSDGDY